MQRSPKFARIGRPSVVDGMGPGIALRRVLALMILLVGPFGCGQPESVTVRISVEGTREGERLDLEVGGVDLGRSTVVHTALLRIGWIILRTDDDEQSVRSPINVNLLESNVVAEIDVVGNKLEGLTLGIDRPPGDGVRRDEPWSVIVGGLLDESPFEYRDDAMQPLEISASARLEGDLSLVMVTFDLKRWFHDIDGGDLVQENGQILLDATHNAGAAAVVEAAIRASLSADDEQDCSSCEESGS